MSDGKERPWTPGPWEYGHGRVYAPLAGRANKIADVSIAHKSSDTLKANGALIAAAPDLYEALRAMIAFWDDGRAHGFQGMEGYQALDRAARAALSRANPQGEEK